MADPIPTEPAYTNSLGMRLSRIEPGTFQMGCETDALPDHLTGEEQHRLHGDFDEHPVHPVTLTRPFYMGTCQVSNVQFEQFDPDHRTLRATRRTGCPFCTSQPRYGTYGLSKR